MKFNVKDKSLQTFFGINKDDFRRQDMSAYHLMTDEIILPKKPELSEGTSILFELEDESIHSRARLLNQYTYLVEKYDDVSVRLKLVDFKIEFIK